MIENKIGLFMPEKAGNDDPFRTKASWRWRLDPGNIPFEEQCGRMMRPF
ncbi:MAG: hypothetical protein LCH39_05000 [Proteobacteria bacterium]|nr:hypothetical protein [Pseudomonadota bacterium]